MGILIGIILLGFCILQCEKRRQQNLACLPRVRYQAENLPLLLTAADRAGGEPNYGFQQDINEISHAVAALSLGSIPDSTDNSLPPPPPPHVYQNTVTSSVQSFRPKRPTTLTFRNPVYENIQPTRS